MRGSQIGLAAAVLALLLGGCTSGIEGKPLAAPRDLTPSAANEDPSTEIDGIVIKEYAGRRHVSAAQRVAYDQSPPFGGAHDAAWAGCDGVVYPRAVRTENMVHSLEHGAVWIAYDPERISGAALQALEARVRNQPYTMLSPYPGLDRPISLQSWGHQLKVDQSDDVKIDEFIQALRRNRFTYPEVGASCGTLGPGRFDKDNPPAFDPSTPEAGQPNVVPVQ